jgi:hypothetical protein
VAADPALGVEADLAGAGDLDAQLQRRNAASNAARGVGAAFTE